MISTNFAISTVWISHKNSFDFRPTLYESILRSYIKQRFTTIFFSPKNHCLQKITNIGCRLRPYKAFTVQGFFSALFSRKIISKNGQDNFLPLLVLHFFKLASIRNQNSYFFLRFFMLGIAGFQYHLFIMVPPLLQIWSLGNLMNKRILRLKNDTYNYIKSLPIWLWKAYPKMYFLAIPTHFKD